MASVDFLARVGRWSQSTRNGYGVAVKSFASCFNTENADTIIGEIRAGRLDPYKALEKYVSTLAGNGLAPKTIRLYLTVVRGLLRHEGVKLDDHEVRWKVGIPPNVESSLDRIPTRDELRTLVLDANPRTRALIALLATSGLRIGEAANLHIGNIDLDRCRVTVMATRSKSRSTRLTFISPEAARLLRDYLRGRENQKDEWLFPNGEDQATHATRGELYQLIKRTLIKTGLRKKLDPSSPMYALHPHAFRKYFFTKLISAGVDRGIAEYLMGHKFGLDNAYLRMAEDRIRKEYAKAEPDFTFLTEKTENEQTDTEIKYLRKQQLKQRRQLQEVTLALRMLLDANPNLKLKNLEAIVPNEP